MEKPDLRLLKNEIVVLNLSANKNIFANTYESSIYDVEEVAFASKKENSTPMPINTKTREGKNSIFVESFQAIRTFPTRPMKQIVELPREIIVKWKTRDKNYSGLFKKNYEVVLGRKSIEKFFKE